jgi:hypothetical protein
VVLEIPGRLMMTPVDAFSDPLIGTALLGHRDLVRGDLLMAVYVMHERRKKEDSFYFPYLNILPDLNNLSEWKDEELMLLQDEALIGKAGSTRRLLKISYAKSIVKLCDMFPNLFPPEEFSFENFVFSWYTIQARAFGRRLPWTALVPFADCLNHKNVQTKYDYNMVESTNTKQFRLLLTGDNRYPIGTEAFNSYGRRPNDNLLIEYGFAMLDNEWDEIAVPLSLTSRFPLFDDKLNMLCILRRSTTKTYYMHTRDFHAEALHFLRLCVCDSVAELEIFRANGWEFNGDLPVVSLANELRALQYFIECMQENVTSKLCSETDLEEDLRILAAVNAEAAHDGAGAEADTDKEGARFVRENRLRPALCYRITRKCIALETMRRTRLLIDLLASLPAPAGAVPPSRVSVAALDPAVLEKLRAVRAAGGKPAAAAPNRVNYSTASSGGDVFSFKPAATNSKSELEETDRLDPYFGLLLSNFIDFTEEVHVV